MPKSSNKCTAKLKNYNKPFRKLYTTSSLHFCSCLSILFPKLLSVIERIFGGTEKKPPNNF